MIILVANLGSTSFKYKLFDMSQNERVLAVGDADRIGQGGSAWSVKSGDVRLEGTTDLADHAAAIELHLAQLIDLGAITKIDDVEAIGFKAVHGGPISEPSVVDDRVLDTMQRVVPLAPAHNPPYIAAMKSFAAKLPSVPQVAAFETGFHQTIPAFRRTYGIPYEWTTDLGIQRYGFHGASHGYIASRMAQIAPDCQKIINLHLGGSCSICAINGGKSVANSFGTTAQSGVFHNNRVGDFDAFAVLALEAEGVDRDEIYRRLGKEGGLLGISGVSPDMREVEEAAAYGDERAKLAVDAFVDVCRQYVGAYLAVLGGADAITFTGGIGQHGTAIRAAICADLNYAGIEIDPEKNEGVDGNQEQRIDSSHSKTQVWVLPTNEELIVARQTLHALQEQNA